MSKPVRTALIAIYGFLTAAGPLAMYHTPPSLEDAVGREFGIAWGMFIFIGAVLCLAGAIANHWLGEFVGLHLVESAVAMYAIDALLTLEETPGRAALAAILLAFSGLLFVRWLDVWGEARAELMRSHAHEQG